MLHIRPKRGPNHIVSCGEPSLSFEYIHGAARETWTKKFISRVFTPVLIGSQIIQFKYKTCFKNKLNYIEKSNQINN